MCHPINVGIKTGRPTDISVSKGPLIEAALRPGERVADRKRESNVKAGAISEMGRLYGRSLICSCHIADRGKVSYIVI